MDENVYKVYYLFAVEKLELVRVLGVECFFRVLRDFVLHTSKPTYKPHVLTVDDYGYDNNYQKHFLRKYGLFRELK